ncbi:spidroin_N domain-containing protein [Caerostris extrusa]|uniref:Spidroin_N domain-containing protein n=1 Tax=Caerostris extrusa TaxID=172846 RepID=A0AAV4Y9B5_CAEEX|nr:spidroin_N domain-containing protein [Caerostris extrusa]
MQGEPYEMEGRIPGPYSWKYGAVPQSGQQDQQPFMFMTGERQPTENKGGMSLMGARAPTKENYAIDMYPDENEPSSETYAQEAMSPQDTSNFESPTAPEEGQEPTDSSEASSPHLGYGVKPMRHKPLGGAPAQLMGAPTDIDSTNSDQFQDVDGDNKPMDMEYGEPYGMEARIPGPYAWRYEMVPQQESQPFMFRTGERQPALNKERIALMGMRPPQNGNIRINMYPEGNEHLAKITTKDSTSDEKMTTESNEDQNLGQGVNPSEYKPSESSNLLGAAAPKPLTSTTVDIGVGINKGDLITNSDSSYNGIELDEDITVYINGKPVGEKDIKEFFNNQGKLQHFEEHSPQEKSSMGPLTMQAPSSLQQSSSTNKENTTQ